MSGGPGTKPSTTRSPTAAPKGYKTTARFKAQRLKRSVAPTFNSLFRAGAFPPPVTGLHQLPGKMEPRLGDNEFGFGHKKVCVYSTLV